MKKLLLVLGLLCITTPSWAQCNGVFPNNTACGNISGSSNTPSAIPLTSFPAQLPGGVTGNIQYNNGGTFGGYDAAAATAYLNIFTSALKGLVPPSGGGTTNYLRADGTFAQPPGASSTINPATYGAICNGNSANAAVDTAGLQAALSAGIASGLPVRFNGHCYINTTLSVTGQVDFGGYNSVNYTGIASGLISTNLTVDMILVNTPAGTPVYFHGFSMGYNGTANSGTAAITITSPSSENAGSKFERLVINGGVSIGLNFLRASNWTVNNNTIVGLLRGILVANANVADSGDSTIVDNHIQTGNGGVGIYYIDSSGLRIINNKINGGGTVQYGIALVLRSGVNIADLFITGNSVEGITNAGGIGIYMVRSGTTGAIGVVNISNNELSGQYCMAIPTDSVSASWVGTIAVTGNTCKLGGTLAAIGFFVDGVVGASFVGNTVEGASSGTNQAYVIGTHGFTSTNCVIGMGGKTGTFIASGAGACTTYAPF